MAYRWEICLESSEKNLSLYIRRHILLNSSSWIPPKSRVCCLIFDTPSRHTTWRRPVRMWIRTFMYSFLYTYDIHLYCCALNAFLVMLYDVYTRGVIYFISNRSRTHLVKPVSEGSVPFYSVPIFIFFLPLDRNGFSNIVDSHLCGRIENEVVNITEISTGTLQSIITVILFWVT